MSLTFGSLFAGIGGFDLGFERAGMRCEWQVEIDPFCQRVLAKHWPNVRRWDDVRTFPPADGEWGVDVICGGFPCQDISFAGKGEGLAGERSGLWSEYIRIIRAIRPQFVVVENVTALLDRGMGRVLGDLAESGLDAEWDCLPSSAFGAYHERDRVFVVAYDASQHGAAWSLLGAGSSWGSQLQSRRLSGLAVATRGERENVRLEREPAVDRMVYGFPGKVDSLRGLGNAVVPQVAEWIGRRIVEAANLDAPRP